MTILLVKLLATHRRFSATSHCIFTMVISLFVFLIPHPSSCQIIDTNTQLVAQKTDIQHFTLDPLQQLYTVSTKGFLTKYDEQGKLLFTYNNTVLGDLTSVDASDPFNILLFFSEQQNLVLLDRTLNERSSLDLRSTSLNLVSAVAISHDNNIWVYDDFESQLMKIDANGNILIQSDHLRLTENVNEQARHIFRWKDKVLVNFPQRGIAVFNLFAQLEDWWPITGITDGQVLHQGFAYKTTEGHFIYLPRPEKIEKLTNEQFNDQIMIRTLFGQQYLLNSDGVLSILKISGQ